MTTNISSATRAAVISDVPADPNTHPRRYSLFWFRTLEIFPGAIMWVALIAPFILSVYFPLGVTLFIIAFDVYWLQKSLVTAYNYYIGYLRFRRNMGVNWKRKGAEISEMTDEERDELGYIDPSDVYHAVIFTTYKEELDILRASIESLKNSDYNHDKLILVLATEERDKDNASRIAAALREEYSGVFYRFISQSNSFV